MLSVFLTFVNIIKKRIFTQMLKKIKNDKREFEQLIMKSSDFVISTDKIANDIVDEIYNRVGLNNKS